MHVRKPRLLSGACTDGCAVCIDDADGRNWSFASSTRLPVIDAYARLVVAICRKEM